MFSRTLDLFIDTAKPGGLACLLEGAQGAARQTALSLVQGDDFTVRLFFRTVPDGIYTASTAVELDAGAELVMAGKADLEETTLLFSATGFTADEDEDLGAFYSARLNLNTSELEEALDGEEDALTVYVDVEVQNADNSRRLTYRFTLTVEQQVYDGEADPTPGTPDYPSPSAVMVKNPVGGSYRFHAGNLQFWNADTAKWHTWFPSGAEGAVVGNWGAGEL